MIVDALGSFLVFATAFALTGFAAAWASRVAGAGPRLSVAVYTSALAMPPAAAAWLVVASLLPLSWMDEPAVQGAHLASTGAAHLVGELAKGFEVFAYAVLGLVGVGALVAAWSSARGHRRLAWVIARLEVAAPAPRTTIASVQDLARQHGIEIGLVHSHHPFSFVWGFRRSKLVVSTGLLTTLTPGELVGVLEHEAAHHVRRDNLAKLLLTLCAHASLATPLARRVLRWRSEQVEFLCDEAAAERTASPLDIAEALVKLRRQARVAPMPTTLMGSGFLPDDDDTVERRVRRLVAIADGPLARPARGWAAFLTAMVLFIVSLAAVAVWSPLAIHSATESLLHSLR